MLDVKDLISGRSRPSEATSNELPTESGVIQASFHQLNGKLKSKNELRREFVSPQVLDRLKQASRQLVNEMKVKTKSKTETAAPAADKLLSPLSNGSPETMKKPSHPDISVATLHNSAAVESQGVSRATSGLVFVEDGDMSEVLSSNADVQPTSQTI